MAYVIRDSEGKILACYPEQETIDTEWLTEDDPELMSFLKPSPIDEQVKSKLQSSDLELIRVIDDLVELLIKKQVFMFTELPLFAQQKLGVRQKIRSDMLSLNKLIDDENEAGIF
jgi:hypothetical protein